MPNGRRVPDATWDLVQNDWYAGATVLTLATRYGVKAMTIYHHAERHGWAVCIRKGGSVIGSPSPKPEARTHWRPGDRLCRSCFARTRTDPCNCCGGISDPIRREA